MLFSSFAPSLKLEKSVSQGANGVVVCQHHKAAEIGAEVLRSGGTAFDAAIAVSFAISVLEPWMSGIGGGGCLVAYHSEDDRTYALDFNMQAFAGINTRLYELESGQTGDLFGWPKVKENHNIQGPYAIAMPGLLAGVEKVRKKWAAMSLQELLEPAIELAKQGLLIDWFSSILIGSEADKLIKDPISKSLWFENNLPLCVDLSMAEKRLINQQFVDTLMHLQHHGIQSFYKGDLSESIIEDLNTLGVNATRDDFSEYSVILQESLSFHYSGAHIHAMPGLFAGSALRRSMTDLNGRIDQQINGPAFVEIALALQRAMEFRLNAEGHKAVADCTTHFSIMDKLGNVVCWTQTLLSPFGSKVTLPRSGILMNNGMMWFDPDPTSPNCITPGAQPLSNMCPVIANHQDAVYAIGASGGRRIMPAVLQLLISVVDFDMDLKEAIDLPRIDVSGLGGVLVDSRLAHSIREHLQSHFDTATIPSLVFPSNFACPSIAVSKNGQQAAIACPTHPWADAAAV